MKVLVTSLNSKYIHTSLGIKYLQNVAPFPVDRLDLTINHSQDQILDQITEKPYDVVCFSVYIWNVEETKKTIRLLKLIHPEVLIAVGGPEVSYESRDFMEEMVEVDFLLRGEGDLTFPQWLLALKDDALSFDEIEGLLYRKEGQLIGGDGVAYISDLSVLPPLYTRYELIAGEKIAYYESSRGCPYRCAYCLSHNSRGVRFFPMDKIKSEVDFLVAHDVPLVKFIDRTFNAKESHAIAIIEYLIAKDRGKTRFHFEINAATVSPLFLDALKKAPPGLFQLEIGVQSTNPETLRAINRADDFERIAQNVNRLTSQGNVHQHLDLIIGLPYEDHQAFERSFNDLYSIAPDKLQLGFLKLLKGTELRQRADEYGLVASPYAPYEILRTKWLSYEGITALKGLEDVVEKFYNEGYFKHTLAYGMTGYSSAYTFFDTLAKAWVSSGGLKKKHSRQGLYNFLWGFLGKTEEANELLKFDYLSTQSVYSGQLEMKRIGNDNLAYYFKSVMEVPKFATQEDRQTETLKSLRKRYTLEGFSFDVIGFIESGYRRKDSAEGIHYVLFADEPGRERRRYTDVTSIVRSLG